MTDNKNYSVFANFYDQYMAHIDYDKWAHKIHTWTKHLQHKEAKKIFELACGTGEIIKRFVTDNNETFGSDNSQAMLDIAKGKDKRVSYFNHDMRDKLPTDNVDLAICVFDSINYLTNENDVLMCFKNVKQSLAKNGLFVFDVSTIYNCIENLDGFINFEIYGKYKVVHMSDWLEDEHSQRSYLEIFEKEGELYKNYQEIHMEKIYPIRTIRFLLESAGFEIVSMHNDEDELDLLNYYPEDIDNKYSRVYFIAK